MQLVVLAEVCATQEKRQLKVCKQLPCAVLVFWMAEADMEIMFFFPFFSPALAEPCFAVHFDETTTVRVQNLDPRTRVADIFDDPRSGALSTADCISGFRYAVVSIGSAFLPHLQRRSRISGACSCTMCASVGYILAKEKAS